jgi:pterin-4a-carbinolamine dehydratase
MQSAAMRRDTPKVPEEKLSEFLAIVPTWKLSEDRKSISKQFVAKNFVAGA